MCLIAGIIILLLVIIIPSRLPFSTWRKSISNAPQSLQSSTRISLQLTSAWAQRRGLGVGRHQEVGDYAVTSAGIPLVLVCMRYSPATSKKVNERV